MSLPGNHNPRGGVGGGVGGGGGVSSNINHHNVGKNNVHKLTMTAHA